MEKQPRKSSGIIGEITYNVQLRKSEISALLAKINVEYTDIKREQEEAICAFAGVSRLAVADASSVYAALFATIAAQIKEYEKTLPNGALIDAKTLKASFAAISDEKARTACFNKWFPLETKTFSLKL